MKQQIKRSVSQPSSKAASAPHARFIHLVIAWVCVIRTPAFVLLFAIEVDPIIIAWSIPAAVASCRRIRSFACSATQTKKNKKQIFLHNEPL